MKRYELGPATGTLTVRTARAGMAARVGHDLVLEVTRWSGVLALDTAEPARSSLALTADGRSLEVREATGGVKPLTNGDRAEIARTIAEKILGGEISFASTDVAPAEEKLVVSGDLTLAGVTRPVRFDLVVEGETVRGDVALTQSAFGIRPFSAFMGALKVADVVEVAGEASLQPA